WYLPRDHHDENNSWNRLATLLPFDGLKAMNNSQPICRPRKWRRISRQRRHLTFARELATRSSLLPTLSLSSTVGYSTNQRMLPMPFACWKHSRDGHIP